MPVLDDLGIRRPRVPSTVAVTALFLQTGLSSVVLERPVAALLFGMDELSAPVRAMLRRNLPTETDRSRSSATSSSTSP